MPLEEIWYDVTFDGEKAGFTVLATEKGPGPDDRVSFSYTRFAVGTEENLSRFVIRWDAATGAWQRVSNVLPGDRVTALEPREGTLLSIDHKGREAIAADPLPRQAIPSAAYFLLVPILERAPGVQISRPRVNEGTGAIADATYRVAHEPESILGARAWRVAERIGDRTTRCFWLAEADGRVLQIDWGGPLSHVMESRDAALAGLPTAWNDFSAVPALFPATAR